MREQMWRAVALFRVVTLAYTAVIIIRDHDRYAYPAAGLGALAIMTGWTVLSIVAYARPVGRRPWLIAADVGVAAALIIATRWVDTATRISHGVSTLPMSWAAAPVLACAVSGGLWAGLVGAAAISAADVFERRALPQVTFNGIVLVLIAGVVGGYVMRLGLRAEAAVDRAARLEAATAEHDRIARGIHDSVLQVLALVSVRGQALGGEAAELGRLAAEQERALRSLVATAPPAAPVGERDLRWLLERAASDRVTVSCPAHPVLLPERLARALASAAEEALSNVARHAGASARAWVLIEDEGGTVTVTMRDNGDGFAPGRLDEAASSGRLGVVQSIMGRLRDVGGEAHVTSSPGRGTEVELRVRRR